jgi:hypothetical protein
VTGTLSDRAVLSVSGPESKSFLQGLITNDVGSLAPRKPLYGALLTPQGKILFDFLLAEENGAILLDCTAESAGALLKRLTMYRLRAKVELALRSELAVLWSAEDDTEGCTDPRLPGLGRRRIGAPAASDASSEYRTHRLALGVPEAADFGSDRMFALDAGLEELHGVSFDKGCYIGQELTARMKHRGTARKRLLMVGTVDGTELPAGGEVRAGNIALGDITSVYGPRGFALIRLDRLAEAGDAPLQVGAVAVELFKPSWLEQV